MAEPNKPLPGPRKELSMEIRLLLALVLMLGVLFTTPYFYRTASPPPPVPPRKEAPAAAVKPEPGKPEPVKARAPEPRTTVSAPGEETLVIDTNLYRVTFSNRGAVVRSWMLKRYKDSGGNQLELVNPAATPKTGYPFSLVFKNQKPSADLASALYVVKKSPDGLGVDFEFSNTRVTSRKSFRFRKDSYLAQVATEVTDGGVPAPHQIAWRGGFGDLSVPNATAEQRTLYYDVAASKLVVNEAKAAQDGPVTSSGTYSFAGLNDKYFAAVFLPPGNGSTDIQTFSDTVATPAVKEEAPFAGAAVGGEGRNEFSLFVGPKDLDILRSVNPKLEQVVDFGFWSFMAKPLFLIVQWLDDHYIHNYGWSIILLTIVLNFALFPLKLTSLKSMKKMLVLQPQIAAIQAKYKNLGMRDPRKQQQNQEIMALYQKHGVNPLGGCVPMLLQMPFLFAFYTVFSIAIEMRGASWLWVKDLSQPEHFAIRILPISMIVTQFLLQRMTPTTGGDPTQQKLMQFMPLIFGFMFYGVPSGLMLYWLTGNLVAIAQQWFFNRTAKVIEEAPAVPVKKKSGRK